MAIAAIAGHGGGLPRGPAGGAPHILGLRNGAVATVRFVAPQDRAELQDYFSGLSPQSRYNRFTGARGGLSDQEFDELLRTGEQGRFAVVARMSVGGTSTVVSEARYAFDAMVRSLEFGLSVHEAFRGQGIGLAMLFNLECRARALGADWMFGDTLWTNDEMQGLGRKAGFALSNTPGDWREIRLRKPVAGRPCAGDWGDAGQLMIA
ncbi:MAG: GNAT family N-acetyltransferase [Xanthobacteraceae bacterium]|nr:GNAT family N-acetyltransferase [Xanthobacteraceae bacterium]